MSHDNMFSTLGALLTKLGELPWDMQRPIIAKTRSNLCEGSTNEQAKPKPGPALIRHQIQSYR